MIKKCKLSIMLLLIAFILIPIFTYPLSTEKVSQSKNEFNFSTDYHMEVLEGYFQEVDDDHEFGYCPIHSVYVVTNFFPILFHSHTASSFQKENLSYQEFSIPPPYLT
jgi:hypothetical protein